jgi:hypothetical protein
MSVKMAGDDPQEEKGQAWQQPKACPLPEAKPTGKAQKQYEYEGREQVWVEGGGDGDP